MKLIFFDTETTGLYPGNICQLAYIIRQDNSVEGKNYYFKVDSIEPGAQQIHGLTVELLDKLSGHKRFADSAVHILKDFQEADMCIAHHFKFDEKFIKAEFRRSNHVFSVRNSFCTMEHFTPICKLKGRRGGYKYPRLEELAACLGLEKKRIRRYTGEIFDVAESAYHDARFDTVTTYLCCMKAAEQGVMPLDFLQSEMP